MIVDSVVSIPLFLQTLIPAQLLPANKQTWTFQHLTNDRRLINPRRSMYVAFNEISYMIFESNLNEISLCFIRCTVQYSYLNVLYYTMKASMRDAWHSNG